MSYAISYKESSTALSLQLGFGYGSPSMIFQNEVTGFVTNQHSVRVQMTGRDFWNYGAIRDPKLFDTVYPAGGCMSSLVDDFDGMEFVGTGEEEFEKRLPGMTHFSLLSTTACGSWGRPILHVHDGWKMLNEWCFVRHLR